MNRFEEFALKLKAQDIDWFKDNLDPISRIHFDEYSIINKKVYRQLRELFNNIYSSDRAIDVPTFGKRMKEQGIEAQRLTVLGTSIKRIIMFGNLGQLKTETGVLFGR